MQVYETMQTDLSQHWTLNMFNVPIILLLTIIFFSVSQVKLLQFIQCGSGTVRRNDNRIYSHIIFNNTTNNSDHLCYTQDEKGFRAVLFSRAPYIHCFHDAGALLQKKGFLVVEHSRRHCVFWVHETVAWVQKKGSLAVVHSRRHCVHCVHETVACSTSMVSRQRSRRL